MVINLDQVDVFFCFLNDTLFSLQTNNYSSETEYESMHRFNLIQRTYKLPFLTINLHFFSFPIKICLPSAFVTSYIRHVRCKVCHNFSNTFASWCKYNEVTYFAVGDQQRILTERKLNRAETSQNGNSKVKERSQLLRFHLSAR